MRKLRESLKKSEEMIVKDRDEYDRFPATSSLGYKEGFIHRPIVNEYAEVFWDWIVSIVPGSKRRRREYRLRLTHDVDQIKKYRSFTRELRISVSLAIKHRCPGSALKRIVERWKSNWGLCKEPYDTFDELMDISEEYGAYSCFYFMASDPNHLDSRYNVEGKQVRKVIENIVKRGHEVGYILVLVLINL